MPDIKTCSSRDTSSELIEQIRSGRLSAEYLKQNFTRRTLIWDELKHTEAEIHSLKALHSILQLGVFFTHRGQIAVFERVEHEKIASLKKITSGLSVLKSWSPAHLGSACIYNTDLARKIVLPRNVVAQAKWNAYGVAYNDMIELDEPMMPFYLFILYRIELPLNAQGVAPDLNPEKNPELSQGWIPYRQYDPKAAVIEMGGVRHPVRGAIDRLVLASLQSRKRRFSDDARGHSFFDRRCRVDIPHGTLRFRPASEQPVQQGEAYNEFIQRISSLKRNPTWREFLMSLTLQLGPVGVSLGTLLSVYRKLRG